MKYLKTLTLLLALLAVNTPARATEQGLAVIELFTTMGCATCPPADRLLDTLAKENDPNTIILSCHVTYFDRPEWKDTLSGMACDVRHFGYDAAIPLNRIFTPQMIINGRFDTYGNREELVRSGIKLAKSMNAVKRLDLKLNNGNLDIVLPGMALEKPAEIWLFSYANAESVTIDEGQNAGETINYARAINGIKKIMAWRGAPTTFSFPVEGMKGDGYAIIAQFENHGEIVAAGQISAD